MALKRSEGYAAVGLFTVLSNLPFLSKAFHIDEPFYLAPVSQILKDPLHPLAFVFNWLGRTQSGPDLYAHSVAMAYPLALAALLTHGSEFGMRLFFLPVDVVSACAVYWLAARFLKRPLWPTLLILAGPAWFLGMPMLMAEKWVMCLLLLGVCALLRGLDDEPRWYWLSALLISSAVALKFTAACVLLPVAAVQWPKTKERKRLIVYLLICAALPALDAFVLEPWRLPATAPYARMADHSFFAHFQHLRALFAFPAACGYLVAVLPFVLPSTSRRRKLWAMLGSAGAAILLFAPALDMPGRPAGAVDRLLGLFFAFGTIATCVQLLEPRRRRLPGMRVWLPWIVAGMGMAWINYLISARAVLLFMPPLILACAETLEQEKRASNALYGSVFAATAVVTLLLARVDADFAGAQKTLALGIKTQAIDQGKKVWFTGHWGFQYYMDQEGAVALDSDAGGWSAVKPGEFVVVPSNNALQLLPATDLKMKTREAVVNEAIPLRLIDVRNRQAGFYASPFGFLPYTISREPLDVFTVVEVL